MNSGAETGFLFSQNGVCFAGIEINFPGRGLLVFDANQLWSLPDNLRSEVEMELRPDEKLLWVGQPSSTRYAWRALPIFIFGIFFGGFAFFWEFMALVAVGVDGKDPIAWVFPLFGLPFVLVGTGMLTSPLWMPIYARSIVYAITTERVVMISGYWRRKILSYNPDRLEQIERTQNADGSGDLIFDREVRYYKGRRSSTMPIGLFAVPNVRDVENIIRTMVEESRQRD